jgi:hypothetical protein
VRARTKPKAATGTADRPWKPPAEVARVLAALDAEPKAFRDLLRAMLNYVKPDDAADSLIEAFDHRAGFAEAVAHSLLDRVYAGQTEADDGSEGEALCPP